MGTFSGHATAAKKVLLLSGTHEGPLLAEALLAAGFAVHATVTRAEACGTLFGPMQDRLTVEARGFTEAGLGEFLAAGGADLVLDATHPFAVRITRIAQAACARQGVPYVRFERPDWEPPAGTHFADSFAEAAVKLPELGTRAMLTIGAKQLKHFAGLHGRMVLFARVLPAPVSIQQALDAGFGPERILGLRPPFSQEFNRTIFREYAANVLVTKASGVEGGVREKVLAAADLGMRVLMIRRPPGEAARTVADVEAAVVECRRIAEAAGEGAMKNGEPSTENEGAF
jgi:precorrin-6A/cobalt-precorrin-6A reductase